MNDKIARILKRIRFILKRYFIIGVPLPLRVVNWLAVLMFFLSFLSLINYNLLSSTILFAAGVQVLSVAILGTYFYNKFNKRKR